MPRQARPSNGGVIDIDAYYARPRGPGPTVIDLTEEPDSPAAPAVPLSGRSSARNPQPHTQLQLQSEAGTGGGGPPRPLWSRAASSGTNFGFSHTTINAPPHPVPPPQLPSFDYSAYRNPNPNPNPNPNSNSNSNSSARDHNAASRSRTQVIDLTGDDLTQPYSGAPPIRRSESIGNIGHRYRYSNNNTPDIIMGEVRRNPNPNPAPPPLPPPPPALAAPGLGAPFRFGSYNPFGRIHGIFLDVTRLAFGQSIMEPFEIEFPNGNLNAEHPRQPEPPPRAPPLPTRDGFTRDTGEDKVAVCPSCNEELAYNPGDSPSVSTTPSRRSSRAKKDGDHHFWAVKKCGHVFCSRCFENRKCKETGFKHVAANKVSCAVDDCTSEVALKSAWIGIYL